MRVPFIAFVLLVSSVFGDVRKWTSADGSRSFEARFVKFDSSEGEVTLNRDGKHLSFPIEKLSEDDRKWLDQRAAREKEEAEALADQDAFESSPLGKSLSKNLYVLQEGRQKRFKLTKQPKYTVIYYGGSFCEHCQSHAHFLVKDYLREIDKNAKVELILVNVDSNPGSGKKWIESKELPFPYIYRADAGKLLMQYYEGYGWSFHLVDRNGESLERGKRKVFNRLKKMKVSGEI